MLTDGPISFSSSTTRQGSIINRRRDTCSRCACSSRRLLPAPPCLLSPVLSSGQLRTPSPTVACLAPKSLCCWQPPLSLVPALRAARDLSDNGVVMSEGSPHSCHRLSHRVHRSVVSREERRDLRQQRNLRRYPIWPGGVVGASTRDLVRYGGALLGGEDHANASGGAPPWYSIPTDSR